MELVVHDLLQMAYGPALAMQEELVRQVQRAAPAGPAHLILVEHNPPVITTGRRACDEQLLIRPENLARMGIELHHTSRGGTITYHGPGQLVAYPILALAPAGLTVRQYVHGLEEAVIQLLARFGLAGSRIDGMTGVWVNGEKIAAIGVAVSRWVTYHGLALNVSTNLDHFNFIVPCGLAGKRVTSLGKCLGRDISLAEVKPAMVECLANALGVEVGGESDTEAQRSRESKEILELNSTSQTPSLCASVSPVLQDAAPAMTQRRFPPWLRMKLPTSPAAASVQQLLQKMGLATVCQAARCPNIGECFSRRTATFMILGDVCTRACRFCAVGTGTPLPRRQDEPRDVALACQRLELKHIVITSVTRDDLPDGGAGQFARTIAEIRRLLPHATVEVLTPDFQGRHADVDSVLSAGPDVFNHNLETVSRLAPLIRPQASYQRSLDILRHAKACSCQPGRDRPISVKSGLMVGLGETTGEILSAMRDLRQVGCDMLTIGQYLAPSAGHAPIERFVEPSEFDALAAAGREMGFVAVASGPLVRSSYHADGLFADSRSPQGQGG